MMKKRKFPLMILISLAVAILPLPFWRIGGLLDIAVIHLLVALAVINAFVLDKRRQTVVCGAIMLLLYPFAQIAAGQLYTVHVESYLTMAVTCLLAIIGAFAVLLTVVIMFFCYKRLHGNKQRSAVPDSEQQS